MRALVVLVLIASPADADHDRHVTWPGQVALGWHDGKDVHVPVVRTRPPALGRAITRWFASLAEPSDCEVTMLSRYAIGAVCTSDGAILTFDRWLQPGLPALELGDLLYHAEVPMLVTLDPACGFDLDRFTLDTSGVTFVPADDTCAQPAIALDELRGLTWWGRELIDWLAARADAGDGAITWTLGE